MLAFDLFLCVSIFYERGCRLWKIRRERHKNTRIFCRCVLFLYHCLLNAVSIDPIQGFINLRSKGDQVAEVPLGGRVVAQSERRSRTVDSQFFSPIINSNISQKVIASDWGRGRSDPSTRYKISAFKRGVRRVPINLRSVVLFFFFLLLCFFGSRGGKNNAWYIHLTSR